MTSMIHRFVSLFLVCAMILLLFPGCASGYISVPIELEQGISFAGLNPCGFMSGMFPGIPVHLNIQHEDFSSEDMEHTVRFNVGSYRDRFESSIWTNDTFTVTNDHWFCWVSHYWNRETDEFFHDDFGDTAQKYHIVFTDIIMRCEGHIIGYAVLCFDRTAYVDPEDYAPSQLYDLSILSAYLFPKQDGAYQDIPLEYVEEQIARAIENYTPAG